MQQPQTEVREHLRSWSSIGSHLIGEYFDALRPILEKDFPFFSPLVRFVVAQLYIDCHLSSESVFLLLGSQKEWDADLVSRAVMEGSVKLTYMLSGAPQAIEEKVDEFWNVLPEIGRLRHHERARRILDGSRQAAADNRPFYDLLIDDVEVERIRLLYPRERRRQLEQKWSFAKICRELASAGEKGFDQAFVLAHGYGMSSHLLHKDGDGVGMVWERAIRSSEDKVTVTLAHCARLIADVCDFAALRTATILRTNGTSLAALIDIRSKYEGLLSEQLRRAGAEFVTREYGQPLTSHGNVSSNLF